jgi:hypothetical protein
MVAARPTGDALDMTASEQITAEVTAWPGVTAGHGRRGEFAFKVGAREIGHLHGDHSAHFAFPRDVWSELLEQGRITEHPVFPGKPGPAARRIAGDADVRDVIALLRLNYDRIRAPEWSAAASASSSAASERSSSSGAT